MKDYYKKYLKYKSKYSSLKKLIGGSNKYDNILKKINDIKIIDDNIYDIYDVLGSNNILNKYYKNEEEVLFKSFKDDMIFVLILDKIAIKIYSSRRFESVRELYDLLIKNDNPNLEYIYEIIYNDNYVIVVSETLEIEGAIKKLTEDDMNK